MTRTLTGITTWSSSDRAVPAQPPRCCSRAAGHDVALVDRSRFPSDVLSTHGIVRGGVVQLARWGLLEAVSASGAPAVREVTFVRGNTEITRTVKERPGWTCWSPRDDAPGRAAARGGRLPAPRSHTGVTATGLRRDNADRVIGFVVRAEPVEFGARYVVGADGLRSRIRRTGPGPEPRALDERLGHLLLVRRPRPGAGNEFHVARDAFAGVFLTHGGKVCLAVRPGAAPAQCARPAATARQPWSPAPMPCLRPWPRGCVPAGPPRWFAVGQAAQITYDNRSARAGHWSATRATTATRSPGTASPTPSATRSCSRLPSTAACVTRPPNPRRWPATPTVATPHCGRPRPHEGVGVVPAPRPLRRAADPAQRRVGARGRPARVPPPPPDGGPSRLTTSTTQERKTL